MGRANLEEARRREGTYLVILLMIPVLSSLVLLPFILRMLPMSV